MAANRTTRARPKRKYAIGIMVLSPLNSSPAYLFLPEVDMTTYMATMGITVKAIVAAIEMSIPSYSPRLKF